MLRAVLVGLLLLRPAAGTTPCGGGCVLAALRAAVIALVVLAMLRPTLVYTETKKEKATLVFLVDQSRSMSVPDGLAGKTPLGGAAGRLADAAPALRELPANFEVKAYAFDARDPPGRGRQRRQDRLAGKARRPAKRPSAPPWRTCCGRRGASGCWA